MTRRVDVRLALPPGFDSSLLDKFLETHGMQQINSDEDSEGESSEDSNESVSLEPVIQDAPILMLPDNILSKIVNRNYHFCRQPTALNGVEIPLKHDKLRVSGAALHYKSQLMSFEMDEESEVRKYLDEQKNWPFTIHLRTLELENDGVALARDLLTAMEARSIEEIVINDQVEYDDLIALVRNFAVRRLKFEGLDRDEVIEYSEDQMRTLLDMPFYRLTVHRIPDELLLSSRMPRLSLNNSDVSADLLSDIIQKFMTADNLIKWEFFEHDLSLRDFMSCFAQFPLFHVGYDGPDPEKQLPVAVLANGDDDGSHLIYYILRVDGRMVQVENKYRGSRILIRYSASADLEAAILRRAPTP